MATFQYFTVDRFGGNRFEHPDAKHASPLETEPSESGNFSLTIPNIDPHIDNVIEWARELQIWRTGPNPGDQPKIWWQGVIINKTLDEKTYLWTVEVVGVLEYFKKLHVGKAKRTNYLTNGSFENGDLSGWSAVGVTANAVTAWSPLHGTTLRFLDHVVSINYRYQANLYQGGSGTDTYLQQAVVVPGGRYWTLAADFHIRTDNTWAGPALDGRGLYLERRHPTTNELEEVRFFAITDDTPRGEFQRAVVEMWSPPGRDSVFWVRLYATRCTAAVGSPPGSIIWDEVQLVCMESLSYTRADIATVANGLITHGQDPAFDKVDLDIDVLTTIAPTDPATFQFVNHTVILTPALYSTGQLIDRAYQYADHEVIFDCLTELKEMGLGDFDIELTWDNANQKAVKTFKWYFPQKGSTTKPYVLELDSKSGIARLNSIEHRGADTINTIIAQGDGQGPDREEAVAQNTTETGGIVLEELFQVATGTHHDLLAGQAGFQVSKTYKVPRIPEIVLDASLTGVVEAGDTFRTVIDLGNAWSIDASYRIVHMSHDFDTDQLTVQVVPA